MCSDDKSMLSKERLEKTGIENMMTKSIGLGCGGGGEMAHRLKALAILSEDCS